MSDKSYQDRVRSLADEIDKYGRIMDEEKNTSLVEYATMLMRKAALLIDMADE